MAAARLYDSLLELPLFLGLSRNDLQEVAGKTKFDFRKYSEDKVIVREGEPCRELFFLMGGRVSVTTVADDHGYSITENIMAPDLFQPEHLFGINPRYSRTYTAHENTSVMCLDKSEVMRLSNTYEIFRLNLLNLYAAQAQKLNRRLYNVPPKSLEERIVRFVANRCVRPAGHKVITVKMTRVAQEVNDSRLDVSHALNHLQDQGLIQLRRGVIDIPALEKLLNQ